MRIKSGSDCFVNVPAGLIKLVGQALFLPASACPSVPCNRLQACAVYCLLLGSKHALVSVGRTVPVSGRFACDLKGQAGVCKARLDSAELVEYCNSNRQGCLVTR